MKTPGGLVLRSVLALIVAGVAYAHGFWTGHFLDLRPTSEYCAGKPLAFPATSWTWLPLTHSCRWSDGTSTDLVPWYVNPIVFVCLAAAVTFVVLAIRAVLRHHRTTTARRHGDVT